MVVDNFPERKRLKSESIGFPLVDFSHLKNSFLRSAEMR